MYNQIKQRIKRPFIFIFLLTGVIPQVFGQDIHNDKSLTWWKLLQGEWTAQDNNSEAVSKFYFDLDKNIIVRENHVEFAAQNGKPSSIHDDLMIIYPSSSFTRAIYFDNEGHVINYSVSSTADTLNFISEKPKDAPVFRLRYIKISTVELQVSFAMAQPDKPDVFKPYLSGTIYKK